MPPSLSLCLHLSVLALRVSSSGSAVVSGQEAGNRRLRPSTKAAPKQRKTRAEDAAAEHEVWAWRGWACAGQQHRRYAQQVKLGNALGLQPCSQTRLSTRLDF